MTGPIIYADRSRIREGKLETIRPLMADLAALVEANEPRILAYHIYIDDDQREMSVIHVHVDAASLRHHLEVAGPAFPRFAGSIDLSRIDIYGDPGEEQLELLRQKARLLGSGIVVRHALEAGFARFMVA